MALSLLCSGSNANGQLATNDLDDRHSFTSSSFIGCPPGRLPAGTEEIIDVACGANHTVLLLRRYCEVNQRYIVDVWGCGDGSKGQLGPSYAIEATKEGFSKSVFRPLDLNLPTLAEAMPRCIAAAWETTYVVFSCANDNDTLVAFGANDFGDLGMPVLVGTQPPTNIINFSDISLDGHNVVVHTVRIRSIAAALHHVLVHLQAQLTNGQSCDLVVGWGAARHGQLGHTTAVNGKMLAFCATPRLILATSDDVPICLSAGQHHSVILHKSGRISSFGSNRKEQLLRLNDISDACGISCTWNGTYVMNNSTILSTGSHNKAQLGRSFDPNCRGLRPVSLSTEATDTHVLKIKCGSEHVLVLLDITEGGEVMHQVWGWGWNEHGNLGVGSTADISKPVQLFPLVHAPEIRVTGIWGGCGTSWIATRRGYP